MLKRLKIFFLVLTMVMIAGCGDDNSPTGPGSTSIQGTWDGQMNVTRREGSLNQYEQQDNIRLELVQRDQQFEGLLIDFDTFSFSDPKMVSDTFLVTSGLLQDGAVSFRTSVPGKAAESFFEGDVNGSQITGTVVGAGFNGVWSVNYSGN